MTFTVPQHMEALEKANVIRSQRANLKRSLSQARYQDARLVAALNVEEPPEAIGGMKAYDLVVACRHVGHAIAHRYLLHAGVSSTARLSDLTERQRTCLAKALREGI